VGIRRYKAIVGLWARGILREHYRISPDDMCWITSEPEEDGFEIPSGVEVTLQEEEPEALLLKGEIDALISPSLAKLFINMITSEAGQRIIYETYLTDHHEMPGSQSVAVLGDLKSRGMDLLRVDVKFAIERPEMNKFRVELVKILREKRR
jgi:hypothetical protein